MDAERIGGNRADITTHYFQTKYGDRPRTKEDNSRQARSIMDERKEKTIKALILMLSCICMGENEREELREEIKDVWNQNEKK